MLRLSRVGLERLVRASLFAACRSVHEVLPQWQGITPAREALLSQFATMLELEERRQETADTPVVSLPSHRLLTLLEQAAAFQVSACAADADVDNADDADDADDAAVKGAAAASPHAPAGTSNGAVIGTELTRRASRDGYARHAPSRAAASSSVTSLLRDYASPRVPNAAHCKLLGHTEGVKTVAYAACGLNTPGRTRAGAE